MKRLLPLLLLLGLLAGLTPTVQAQDASDWAVTVLPSNGQSATSIVAGTSGEVVGVSFEGSADSNTYFLLRNGTTASFVIKNSDVTGTVNLGFRDMAAHPTDPSTWMICGHDPVAVGIVCWHTTNYGTTWTQGGSGLCAGSQATILALRIGADSTSSAVCRNSSPGTAKYHTSSDLGASWSSAQDISDNQGDPSDTPTASINARSASMWPSDTFPAEDVEFTGTSVADVFSVGTADGFFWTVPYNAEGGTSTVNVNSAYCGNTYDYGEVEVRGPNTRIGAASITSVAGGALCVAGDVIAGANGATLMSGVPHGWLAGNPSDQYLVAFADLTANENYVYYKATPAAAPVLSYTNSADTTNFNIVMTPTLGYFFYQNNAFGGRFEVATATVFSSTGTGDFESWCSNPGVLDFGGDPDADFGYNYAEQVTFEEFGPLADIELNDAFLFQSESNNAAYLGKGWESPGSKAVKVYFNIEGGTEGTGSVFRTHFSFEAATPSATSKGDGQTTGSFTDFIGSRFEESGSTWRISLIYNSGGQDPFLTYGSTVVYAANPNTPRLFSLTVDTRGNGFATIRDEDLNQSIIHVPSLAGSGAPLLASKAEDPMYSQWFVTTGTSSVLTARTALDDPQDGNDSNDSTCIFFLDQPITITGDPGTTPPSEVPDVPSPPAPPSTPLGDSFADVFGVDSTAGGVLAAIFWILVFAAGAYGIFGGSPIGLILGALCGFVYSIFTDLLPDVLVFIIVLLAAVFLGMRLFGGSNDGVSS